MHILIIYFLVLFSFTLFFDNKPVDNASQVSRVLTGEKGYLNCHKGQHKPAECLTHKCWICITKVTQQ